MTITRRTDVRDLDDDPSWLATAEGGWQSLISSSSSAASTTTSVRERVAGAWEGTYADGYLAYAPTSTPPSPARARACPACRAGAAR